MSDVITERDPIIVHDFKPTHPRKPEWVTEAENVAAQAWNEYEHAIDEMMDAGELDHKRLAELHKAAHEAEAYKRDMLGYWHSDHVPASVAQFEERPEHYKIEY